MRSSLGDRDPEKDGRLPGPGEATVLLPRAAAGDAAAGEALYGLLRAELHGLARGCLNGASPGHTLQATALVNEAWLRLFGTRREWNHREHFLGVAARAMRSVVIDHARRRTTLKRGGDRQRHSLDEVVDLYEESVPDLIGLDEAISRLARNDERRARVVELRFFGGLTFEQVAAVLGVAPITVRRDWDVARLWLRAELGSG